MTRPVRFAPLRDIQRDEPVCCCSCCGGELYAGSLCYVVQDEVFCEDCVEKTTGRDFAAGRGWDNDP